MYSINGSDYAAYLAIFNEQKNENKKVEWKIYTGHKLSPPFICALHTYNWVLKNAGGIR